MLGDRPGGLMDQFDTMLAAAFDLDPARLPSVTTSLVIDDFESLTASFCTSTFCSDGNGHPCFSPDPHDTDRAAFSACFGDGSVSPCFAPPDRLES
jgi:hypothetical protein